MSKFKGKNVLVVGFGVSGVAVTKHLAKQGAKVVVTDMKQKSDLMSSLKACADLKVEYDFGKHTPKYFQSAELIVVSPGVPLDMKLLEEAKLRGCPIVSEIDLAASQLNEPVIAVSGTNGKTTTATLISEIFKADEKKVFLGGNIGAPLVDHVNDGSPVDWIVAELSSFQLELTEKLSPAVAVFTNIDQDHLDRYGSMDRYVEAKKRLINLCSKNSFVVLNYDDPRLQRFANGIQGKVYWYLKRNPMDIGGDFSEQFCGAYYVPGSNIIVGKFGGQEETYDVSRLRIFGDHNKENLMGAICAARAVGIRPTAIQKVIDSFQGIDHRLELVRKKDGVFFINDSKATNVNSVHRSLSAFKKNPIILISGGKDKDMDFSPLASLVNRRCKILILIGEAKEKINRAIGDESETHLVGTFEEAVLLAYQKSRSGDIILLSPGCASYDMFRNFEERGDYFKKLVAQL